MSSRGRNRDDKRPKYGIIGAGNAGMGSILAAYVHAKGVEIAKGIDADMMKILNIPDEEMAKRKAILVGLDYGLHDMKAESVWQNGKLVAVHLSPAFKNPTPEPVGIYTRGLKGQCCGRCDGVHDICVADMEDSERFNDPRRGFEDGGVC